MTDNLSSQARNIISANPHAYEALVVESGTPALAHQLLDSLQPAQLLAPQSHSKADPNALLAALWLWHDGLDESHKISQSITTPTGSFWHAIMHRREGDFSNSKYWYAKTARHPAYAILAQEAAALTNPMPADSGILKITASGWNANAFVDFVESVHDKPTDPRHAAAIALQQLEWRTLFDLCAQE